MLVLLEILLVGHRVVNIQGFSSFKEEKWSKMSKNLLFYWFTEINLGEEPRRQDEIINIDGTTTTFTYQKTPSSTTRATTAVFRTQQ